jgi:hypothetical protein
LITDPLTSSASTQTSTGFIGSASLTIMLLIKLPVHVLSGTGSLLESNTGCNNVPVEILFAESCTGTSKIPTNQIQK